MTVDIQMRNSLDAIQVPGDFATVVTQLNLASAKGNILAIVGADDEPVAINIANINSIRETDESSIFG